MKASRARTLALSTAAFFVFAPLPAFAALGDAAGVAGAVQGTVAMQSPARSLTIDQVASGQDVVMGDAVNTRAQSRLQIMLLDQTAITMGENASLVIDEFVYDPAGESSALSASVAQGAFRLVTGGVARSNPEGTKVKLPAAVLTIRGTTASGNCDGSGCIVALGGTGDNNSAGKKPSQIVIESDKDRKVLKRAGFFVLIRPDGTITDPEPLEDEAAKRLASLFDPLTGQGSGGGDYLGGAQLIEASGQPRADGGPVAEEFDDVYGDVTALANTGFESTSNLPSGQLTYFADDIPMAAIVGSGAIGDYDVSYTLDLASRDFDGTISISASGTSIGTINGTFQLLHDPFEVGFSDLHESGAVITTGANDSIVVDYSLGPSQMDTSVVYTVNPTFGGPVVLSGSGPAPIVP